MVMLKLCYNLLISHQEPEIDIFGERKTKTEKKK